MTPRANRRPLYVLLAVVFVLAMGYQVAFSIGAIQYRRHFPEEVLRPFEIGLGSDRIVYAQRSLADQGVRPGDRLVSIEGQAYEGAAQVSRILSGKRPGQGVAIRVLREGHGEPEDFAAPLTAAGTNHITILGWIILVCLTVATPMFCLLLGFGVTAIRPRDPLAWLLLMLMLAFAQMSTSSDQVTIILLAWPDIVRPAALSYHVLMTGTWPVWVLLFGLYFPERFGIDRRWPWLKWLLIVPIGLVGLGDALVIASNAENFHNAAALEPMLARLRAVTFYLSMAAISSFFFSIGTKIGTATTADARRRLILLMNGTGLSLTPLFILVLYTLFRGTGFATINETVWIPCILMLALFPITLAYVIVVQRALDVRVVVRQGLRYALAKRGILVLRVVAFTVIITAALTLAMDPERNRPRKIQVIGLGIAGVVFVRRASETVRGWIDRRFFREAYNAEQILSELSDEVRTMVETGPLLETVAKKISGSLHVPRIAMLVRDDGHYAPAYALGYDAPPDIAFDQQAPTVAQLKQNREPLRVYFDDPDSWVYGEAFSEIERDRLQRLEAQLLLPLAFKDKLIGFMSLSAKQSEEPYSKSDVQLLGSVAMQTGLALENSQLTSAIASEVALRERMNRELEIAREVQERLFPQNYPKVAGLDIAGRCRPAQGVGGDYYDFLELPDGSLGIGIGDVSGKGIPAALLMASLQASLRGQTIAGSADLAKLMTNVNKLIYDTSPANRYATFFYGQYEPGTRRLTYVNGGHNPPMVFRDGEVLRLEEGGPVVGLFKPSRYSQAAVTLSPGDVLVLFTDGISEAMNAADDEWGEERLMDAVRECRERCAGEMINALIRDADAFAAGAPQHDDMTVMVVKVL